MVNPMAFSPDVLEARIAVQVALLRVLAAQVVVDYGRAHAKSPQTIIAEAIAKVRRRLPPPPPAVD
jgi:hypothetical protein